MVQVVQCSCGKQYRIKGNVTRQEVTCPSCGGAIALPNSSEALSREHPSKTNGTSNSSSTRASVRIDCEHMEVDIILKEFFDSLRMVDLANNPFRDKNYALDCLVVRIREGNQFVRYLFLNTIGRPKITAEFRLTHRRDLVVTGRVASTVFFLASRDAEMQGGYFGGTNTAFIRTNCRNLVMQIVDHVARCGELSKEDVKQLKKALRDVRVKGMNLKWVIVPGIAVGVLLTTLVTLIVLAEQETNLAELLFLVPVWLILFGFVGAVSGWFWQKVFGLTKGR